MINLKNKLGALSGRMAGFANEIKSPEMQKKLSDLNWQMAGMTGGVSAIPKVPSEFIPNQDMNKMMGLERRYGSQGNVSIPETNWIMQKGKEFLRIPQKIKASMGPGQQLGEMTGMATPNQDYIFRQLPEKVALELKNIFKK